MLGAAFKGSRTYWSFLALLVCLIAIGVGCWVREHQLGSGLTTGLGRDVPWGLHVGQLTFFVGVAASAAMVLLPYYVHDYGRFGRLTVLGEFLAVAAVIVGMLSVFAIMGQPARVWYVLLYPTPGSIIFWDLVVLSVYLVLNLVCGFVVLGAESRGLPPPRWIKPVIYLAIAWAPSIHTVTAFLYSGLPGRHHWMTSLQAVHFLATAFAAGPALLIVLCLLIKRVSRFDPGTAAIQKLSEIVLYALGLHVFFIGLEFFTAFYSQSPGPMQTLQYLYLGLEGHHALVPVMWTSSVLGLLGLVVLAIPATRRKEATLAVGALAVFFSVWLDKGFAFVVAGSIPNAMEQVHEYWPHPNELLVATGVWAVGALVLTVLYKITIAVKEQVALDQHGERQLKEGPPPLRGQPLESAARQELGAGEPA